MEFKADHSSCPLSAQFRPKVLTFYGAILPNCAYVCAQSPIWDVVPILHFLSYPVKTNRLIQNFFFFEIALKNS